MSEQEEMNEVNLPVELPKDMEVAPIQTSGFNLLASDINIEEIEKRAQNYVNVQNSIRKIAITATNNNDWIDQGGKPYLQWTGTSKIARSLGVSYANISYESRKEEDEQGVFLIVECMGTVLFNGAQIIEIGTGSSRDSFFGVRSRFNQETNQKEKYFLPMSEVDICNIKKKALTNFMNRGLKSIVGLSFTWEEVEAAGISRNAAGSVNYGNKGGYQKKEAPKPTAEGAAQKDQVWSMLMDIYKDKKGAGDALMQLTTWKDNNGKQVPGKAKIEYVSEKQVKFLFPKVKQFHDEWKAKHRTIDINDDRGPSLTQGKAPNKSNDDIPQDWNNQF